MNVGILKSPDGETFANINDLIALFKDVKEHPEKYDKGAVVTLIGQLAGSIKKEEPKNPF